MIDISTNLPPDPTVFTQDPLRNLLLYTVDPKKVKTYKLQIRANIPIGGGPTYSHNFVVVITDKCLDANIVTSVINDQNYTLGSTPLKIFIDPWFDNVGKICGEIAYDATLSDGRALDNTVVQFDQI